MFTNKFEVEILDTRSQEYADHMMKLNSKTDVCDYQFVKTSEWQLQENFDEIQTQTNQFESNSEEFSSCEARLERELFLIPHQLNISLGLCLPKNCTTSATVKLIEFWYELSFSTWISL